MISALGRDQYRRDGWGSQRKMLELRLKEVLSVMGPKLIPVVDDRQEMDLNRNGLLSCWS